jgi:RHS repeat-associated protein
MHRKYLLLPLLIPAAWPGGQHATAQTHPAFVQQENMQVAGITADSLIYPLSTAQKHTVRVYADGLGRSIQTVAVQASPLQNDMIAPVAYDHLGRQTVGYLPYAGQAADTVGSYRSNATGTAQPAFYNQTTQYLIAVDTAAHVNQVYESSPLQRLLSAGDVGAGYQPADGGTQHYKTATYRPNSYTADGHIYITGTAGAFGTAYYADNTLWVTDAINEDGAEALTFTDLAGRTICKRIKSGNSSEPNYDTYYVYNAAGMLKYIVPPKAIKLIGGGATLSTPAVANLIYSYSYNTMGQLVSKTVPGSGASSIVYDPLNRPVLLRDTNLYASHQWHYIKYDAKNRPVMTGIYTDATHTTRTAMQSYVSGLSYSSVWYESRSTGSTYYYYTNTNVFPTTATTVMSYSYYDSYDFNDDGIYDYSYKSQGLTGEETATTDSLKGVPTMSLRLLAGPGISGSEYLMTVQFYDHYGHAIQSRSNNQLYYTAGTLTDSKTTVPDFTGKPLVAKALVQSSSATTNYVITTFNYDISSMRIASIDQVYNTQAKKRIAAYVYNEAGQLILRKLDSLNGSWLQNVDYRYNIRGQLLYINNSKLAADTGKTNNDSNDVFGMAIMYDKPDTHIGTVTPSYSGRVSAVKWMTLNGTVGTKTNERSYVYNYDKMGEDTSSWYAERGSTSTAPFGTNLHGFDEYGITYDDAGNITAMKRNSSTIGASSHTLVDNLTYTYDSTLPNQLDNVYDATGNNTLGFRNLTGSLNNYSYDVEGNLTADPYKGLTLKYNSLVNRADSLLFNLTGSGNPYITYTYDATGSVVRKQLWSTPTTLAETIDYIGGFVYTTASGATTLSYIQNIEGRIINNAGTLTAEYVISDQQGNARFSFSDNGTSLVVRQENSYYAFGEQLAGSPVSTPTTPNINLYNGGSEWQALTTGMPDYNQTFYRNYDPAVARFIAADPMPESAESMNVYQYAGNDPVNMNDPMGDLLDPARMSHPNGNQQPVVAEGNHTGLGYDDSNNPSVDIDAPPTDEVGTPGDGDYSGFWNALIGGLNDIQGLRSATYDGNMIAGMYNAFETAMANGDQSITFGVDPSASNTVVIGVSVISYNNQTNPTDNDPGAHLILGYKVLSGNASGIAGYNIAQTYSYDCGTTWNVDNRGHADDLYYANSDITDVNALLTDEAAHGFNEAFTHTDWPSSSEPNHTVLFQSTLLIVGNDNKINAGISVQWGYQIQNGISTTMGSAPIVVPLSPANQAIISQYNKIVTSTTSTPTMPQGNRF